MEEAISTARSILRAPRPGSPIAPKQLWRWLPHVLIGLLALPFIIRQNAWYEWSNALWLLDLQTAHVRAFGSPTFFIDAGGLLFYPQQLFYAGPTVAVLAYPSVIIGTWPVFAFTTAAAFSAMSSGVSWSARNLGAPPQLAVLPGLMFAATPYAVSNLYGRGDWAELVAVGALALAIGAGTSLALNRARSPLAVTVALALSVGAVAGTHNITLLFGGIFAALLTGALASILRGASWRGLGLTVLGTATGVALCGGFLVPDLWLSGKTYISGVSYQLVRELHGFDRLTVIFDPLAGQPHVAAGTFDHPQTLVAGAAWCIIALALVAARRALDRRLAVPIGLMVLLGVGTVLLIVHPDWWEHFPTQLQAIQFPFRLLSYLALTTVLLIALLLACGAVSRDSRLVSLLCIATALQLGLAGYIAVSSEARPQRVTPFPNPSSTRAGAVPAAYGPLQRASYRITDGPVVAAAATSAYTQRVGDDTPPVVHLFGAQQRGTLVSTTVTGSPLVRVSGGATLVGTSPQGTAVLRVRHSPWRATVTARCEACLVPGAGDPLLLVVGHWTSLCGAAALLGLIGAVACTPPPRRRRADGDTTGQPT